MIISEVLIRIVENDDVLILQYLYDNGKIGRDDATMALCKAIIHNKPKCNKFLTQKSNEMSQLRSEH